MVHDGEFSVCYSLLLRGGTCNYTSRVSYRVFGLGGGGTRWAIKAPLPRPDPSKVIYVYMSLLPNTLMQGI